MESRQVLLSSPDLDSTKRRHGLKQILKKMLYTVAHWHICFNAESTWVKFHPQLIKLNAILASTDMYIVVLTVVHMTCPHLQSLKKIGVHLWKVVVASMLPLRIFFNSDSVGYFHSIISYWSFQNWSLAFGWKCWKFQKQHMS